MVGHSNKSQIQECVYREEVSLNINLARLKVGHDGMMTTMMTTVMTMMMTMMMMMTMTIMMTMTMTMIMNNQSVQCEINRSIHPPAPRENLQLYNSSLEQ